LVLFLRSAALEGPKGSGGELTILLRARNGIAPQQAKKSGQAFSANVFEASFWRKFWVLSKPFWARPLRGKDGSGYVSHPGGRPCSQLELVCEVPDWRHTVTAFAWFLLVALLAQIFKTTWLLVKLNFQQGSDSRGGKFGPFSLLCCEGSTSNRFYWASRRIELKQL